MAHPPVVWSIELSEALSDAKIIAEAWDAAGLYQIGYFPGYRWAEWNGRFRDDVRRFVRGDPGLVGAVASRLGGSSDIYQTSGHLPINSINFVTCHDGFTLNDLVSYNGKHNEANGEENRDGINDNLSWNCGAEGESNDPAVEALRSRQIRNFAAILLLARGVPMILAGDEIRRTQKGNNNAYCQNNEITWSDWRAVKDHTDLLRFWRLMIDFRKRHPAVHRARFFDGKVNERGLPDVSWHGCQLLHPGWNDPNARALAFTLAGFDTEADIHVILNMDSEGLDFELPVVKGRQWHLAVNTAEPSPKDIVDPGSERPIAGSRIRAEGAAQLSCCLGKRILSDTILSGKKGTGPICAQHPPGRSGKLDLSPFFLMRVPFREKASWPVIFLVSLACSWHCSVCARRFPPGATPSSGITFAIRSL